jgi:hydroxymethylglutaryl-CoA lyase
MSVSVSHNKANINRSHDDSFTELGNILSALPDMRVRVDLATAFACPFEGWISPEAVIGMAKTIYKMGIRKMVLADTIGVAGPDRVSSLCHIMRQEFPDVHFSLHLHDTRGTGLANTMAGLQAGIDSFETSVAGLGGCPFAPGAAGNTATEDMVSMLGDMNISTGVDLQKLLAAVVKVQANVDAPVNSHLSKAKLYDCLNSNKGVTCA